MLLLLELQRLQLATELLDALAQADDLLLHLEGRRPVFLESLARRLDLLEQLVDLQPELLRLLKAGFVPWV